MAWPQILTLRLLRNLCSSSGTQSHGCKAAKAKQRARFIPLLVYLVIIGWQLSSEHIPGSENTEVNTMYNNPCFHWVYGQYEGLTMKKNVMCCHVKKKNTAGKLIQSSVRGRAYWGRSSPGRGGQGRIVTFDKRYKWSDRVIVTEGKPSRNWTLEF